jgi:selenocysteine-specific elongation factor
VILGTAGHIDHGKTALVRALTGVDTDRLPEEKRRGITIELGFAPLKLADDVVLGVVDVPGHEAFVRTMVAGATGIDIALLVIAADEGPMPQTHEHLSILQLLDVPHLIVALTKSDLVDAEWLSLVTEEVRELLHNTPYAAAEIIATSTTTDAGLDLLRSSIAALAHRREAPPSTDPSRATRGSAENDPANDLFRLPIDRSFTVRGTGTVVTGTVWSGSLSVDETVRIMPAGASARVRGLQNHGESVRTITPGMRAAIALAGVEPQTAARGATLVTSKEWEPSVVLRADVTLLPGAPQLRPRTKVRFHLATSDVGARVVAVGTAVSPGTSRPVRIVLDEPVMARAGDRFVLRSASPLATIGGGVITDPNAPRRARPMPKLDMTREERLSLLASESGLHGLRDSAALIRVGVPPTTYHLPPSANGVVHLGDRWYSRAHIDDARARLTEAVRTHHEQNALAPGVSREEIRSRVGLDTALFDQIVDDLVKSKQLEVVGAELRIPGRAPEVSDKQRRVMEELFGVIAAAGREPPSVAELQQRFGLQTVPLLRHLERQQRVIQVEDGRFYTPEAVRELLRRLEAGMSGKGEFAPTDLREMLGFSRKYLIPFLEYCDKKGYTQRQGNARVWRAAKAS